MATTQRPTAVARVEPPAAGLAERPELKALTTQQARAFIEPLLQNGVTFERVLSEVYAAMVANPKLVECTPASLLTSVGKAVGWGLTIGDRAHIVPFGTTATAIMDYKGAIDLVVRAGGARYIDAQCVFANERFTYEQGTTPFIKHSPIMSPSQRGPLIGAYAVAKINATDVKITVLSAEEIEGVRQKYSKQWKGGKLDDLLWYGQKTCVRRIVKQLPMNPRMEKLMAELEAEEDLIEDGGLDPANRVEAGTPAADADGVSTDVVDAANDFKVPGSAKHFEGNGGKPLSAVETPALRKIRKWAADALAQAGFKVSDAGADPLKVDLLRAIEVVLTHRQDTEEAAPPTPAGPVNMPTPGKIEDTVKPTTPLPAAKPAGPTLMDLAGQVRMLLDTSDRPASEKAELRKKYDAAVTRDELQALKNDLEFPI